MRKSSIILSNLSPITFAGSEDNKSIDIMIPDVDNDMIEPKFKIYESDNITYWYPQIGFTKFTDPNHK